MGVIYPTILHCIMKETEKFCLKLVGKNDGYTNCDLNHTYKYKGSGDLYQNVGDDF